jgi:hypothetical protein
MAEHLDKYVMDFVDQFEVMHDDIQFGDELKQGTYRYPFSIDYLKKLEKFLTFKNMRLVNAGHMWIGQDTYVLNSTFSVGLCVLVTYNELEQVLSFAPHSYFFRKKGRYTPFGTFDEAMRFAKRVKTHDLMHEIS